jgi:hypothetical protein
MRTDDLIAELAGQVSPVHRHAAARRLALGTVGGGLVAFALLLLWLGLRPDLAEAAGSAMFWMKLAFTVSLGLAAFAVVDRLGRPGAQVSAAWWALAAPVAVVAMMGAAQIIMAPEAERLRMWLGHSAADCPLRIVALAVPVYAGLLWSFRRLAPTRLALAGFGAGVMAGCVGATVYALYCTESAAAFLATWYTLGILGSGALGALLGPRLLRW